jgi:hypothetical protein
LFLLAAAACGGEDFRSGAPADAAAGGGGAGSTGGTGSAGSTGGSTGSSSAASGGGDEGGGGAVPVVCTPGETVPCYLGPAGTSGVGACHDGTRTCADDGSEWGLCEGEVVPVPETCATPEDDDCDGAINEEGDGCVCLPGAEDPCYEGPDGTEGVGQCSGGVRTCSALGTDFSACEGQVLPGVEDCAHLGDEDCDGVACSEPLWWKVVGDGADQMINAVATDLVGNVYVAGTFEGALDFGAGGPGPLVSAGGDDAFVAKLDPSGTPVWAKRFGDGADQQALALAVDPSGDVIITGTLEGTVDFGGGPLTSLDLQDGFVLKLSSAGVHQWSRRFGDVGNQVAGAVAVGGHFGGRFDPCALLVCPWDSHGSTDAFVARYDAAGTRQWVDIFGDALPQEAHAVGVDSSGSIVVVGSMAGTVDFGSGPVTALGTDAFVARVDAAGARVFGQVYGDAAYQDARALALDASGNAWIVGRLSGSADFGGGALAAPNAGKAMFLFAMTSTGEHLLSKRFGDGTGQYGTAVRVGADGRIVVGASSTGTIDFGAGPIAAPLGIYGMAIAKLEPDGSAVWSRWLGTSGFNALAGLATRQDGSVVAGGASLGVLDFGEGPITSAGLDGVVFTLAP